MLCPQCHGSGWLPSIDARGPRPCEACGQLGSIRPHVASSEGAAEHEEAGDVWQEWIDHGCNHD